MSELGSVPKKSLVARFDESRIITVATSPDDPERLFVNYSDSDGQMIGTKSLSIYGGYNYPTMHVKVINNTGNALTFPHSYRQSEYGMSSESVAVDALSTKEFVAVGVLDKHHSPVENHPLNTHYLVNLTKTPSGIMLYSDLQNCKKNPGNDFMLILDPSLDSYVTLTVN